MLQQHQQWPVQDRTITTMLAVAITAINPTNTNRVQKQFKKQSALPMAP